MPSTTTPANAPNCLTGYRWETLYGGVSAPLRGPLGSRVSGGIRWTTINQVDPRTGDPVTLLYPWMWGELGVEASAKTPPAAVRLSGTLGAYGNYWWAPELTFRTQAEADEFRRAFTQDRSAALERFRDRVTAHWYAPTVITSAQGRVEGRRGPVGTDVLAAYIEQDYTWALVTYPNSSNFDLYWMPYRDEYINSGGIVAGVQWRWLREFTLLGASFDGDGQLTGARMIARRAEAGPEGFLGPNVRIGGRVAFDLRSKAYRNGVFNQQTHVARLDDPEIARQFRELLGVSPGADSWRVTRWLRSMLPGWAMPGATSLNPVMWSRFRRLITEPGNADVYDQRLTNMSLRRPSAALDVGRVSGDGFYERWTVPGDGPGSTASVNGRPWADCERHLPAPPAAPGRTR